MLRCFVGGKVVLGPAILLAALAPATYGELVYPAARQDATVEMFQVAVADPYRWLEDLDSEETRAFVEGQNALALSYLDALPATAWFDRRLERLFASGWDGIPHWTNGGWLTREIDPGLQSTWWMQDTLDGDRRPILRSSDVDPEGNARIRWVAASPDGKLVAYSVVVAGGDLEEVRFREIATRDELPDRIKGIKFSVPVWAPDGSGIVYARYLRPGNFEPDGIDREPVVAYHRLGTSKADDRILLRAEGPETDGDGFRVDLGGDGRYLVLRRFVAARDQYRSFVLDLGAQPTPDFDGTPVPLGRRLDAALEFIGAADDGLYFWVQDEIAPKGRVIAVAPQTPDTWRTIVPESETVLADVVLAGGRLVVLGRRDVQAHLRVFELDGRLSHAVELPAPGSVFGLSGPADQSVIHFGFDAFAYPPAILRHDLTSRRTTRIDTQEHDFDRDGFVSRQVFVPSSGGVRVPVFITHRRNLRLPAPTLLHAYGAVDAVVEPQFRSDWGAWMDAGGVLAVANVRGGGAYGAAWSDAGSLERRQNTHDDFIAAATYLVEEGITSRAQLAIIGASNGGMLVGAVVAQRPELFVAALPQVPVMDVIRFASLTAGPRMVPFIGNPEDPFQVGNLLAWSPLHKLRDGVCYPATLVVTARDDDLVHPSQSYKYAARLQAAQGCDRPVLLTVAAEGGHYGSSNPTTRRRESARELAFAATMTGLVVP